uniref:Uncharacterized protein n=1 Tax=Solanum lycopersicum TaxID=4081 RepID=A0A3Q7JL74_SOLLC
EIKPNSDFTAEHFLLQVVVYIVKILKTQRASIIIGWSNSYIEKLVEDHPVFMFKYKYDILNRRFDMRVDQMVKADYTKGIRRSIGVPEMDKYLREKTNTDGDDESTQMILQASIYSIKCNTCMLIRNQLDKIQRLINEKVIEDLGEACGNTVLQPCLDIVKRFLKNDNHNIIIECT